MSIPEPSETTAAGVARMSFVEHLRELRYRLMMVAAVIFIATFAAFAFAPQIFEWIRIPLAAIDSEKMQVLSPLEMFITYLKLAVLAALFASSPWVLVQVWLFVAPGLYSHEKKWIVPFVFLGTIFFVGGAAFAFYVVMPFGFKYLVAMVPDTVEASYRVSEYISFVIRLLLAFGIVFELPLVMWILAAAGVVKPENFSKLRKYWFVIAVIIGAFLTPPDPMTQIMMAIPLVLFFELGILGARMLYPTRRKKKA